MFGSLRRGFSLSSRVPVSFPLSARLSTQPKICSSSCCQRMLLRSPSSSKLEPRFRLISPSGDMSSVHPNLNQACLFRRLMIVRCELIRVRLAGNRRVSCAHDHIPEILAVFRGNLGFAKPLGVEDIVRAKIGAKTGIPHARSLAVTSLHTAGTDPEWHSCGGLRWKRGVSSRVSCRGSG